MPFTLVSQIALGVKCVSRQVRSIVQLVTPLPRAGTRVEYLNRAVQLSLELNASPEKRNAAEILRSVRKPVLRILKLRYLPVLTATACVESEK